MKKLIKFLLTIMVLTLFILPIGCGDDDDDGEKKDTIKIGVLVPYSGSLASIGEDMNLACELAISEINGAGGIFDKDIEIILADSKADPDEAVISVQKLIDKGVVAIIGPATSSSVQKVATEKTIAAGIPIITPSGTAPTITDIDDNGFVWRTVASDQLQGQAAATVAYNDGHRTAGIIHLDNLYGLGLASSFTTKFEQLGGTVVNTILYDEMDEAELEQFDFTEKVDQLFQNSPDIIFMVSYETDGAKISHVMKNKITDTYNPSFLGSDGIKTEAFALNAAEEVVVRLKGTAPGLNPEDANLVAYKANFKTLNGHDAGIFSENAYDAMYIIVYAMLQANSEDPADIKTNLESVSKEGTVINVNQFAKAKTELEAGNDIDYNGASGNLEFNTAGDPTSASYILWHITDEQTIEDLEYIILK